MYMLLEHVCPYTQLHTIIHSPKTDLHPEPIPSSTRREHTAGPIGVRAHQHTDLGGSPSTHTLSTPCAQASRHSCLHGHRHRAAHTKATDMHLILNFPFLNPCSPDDAMGKHF